MEEARQRSDEDPFLDISLLEGFLGCWANKLCVVSYYEFPCFNSGYYCQMNFEETKAHLGQLRLELKQKISMLEMMKSGTTPDSLAKLKKEWLEPIEQRIRVLEKQETNR